MILKSCTIENFGTLSSFSINIDPHLTTICEDNGWGKTTLANFICCMFYGFKKTHSTALRENDRLKFAPWQGGTYGGTIFFDANEKNYKLTRTFGLTPEEDTFELVDLKTGLISQDFTENIGVELFGVDASSFEKTFFISETLSEIQEETDFTTIQAKLVEAEDLSHYEEAIKLLDKKIAFYRQENGNGVLLDLQERIQNLEKELAIAQNSLKAMNQKHSILKEYQVQIENIQKQIEELENAYRTSSSKLFPEYLKTHYDRLQFELEEQKRHVEHLENLLDHHILDAQMLEHEKQLYDRFEQTVKPTITKAPTTWAFPVVLFVLGLLFIVLGILLGSSSPLLLWILPIIGGLSVFVGLILGIYLFTIQVTQKQVEEKIASYERLESHIKEFIASYPKIQKQVTSPLALYQAVIRYHKELKEAKEQQKESEGILFSFLKTNPQIKQQEPATSFNQEFLQKREALLQQKDELSAKIQALTIELGQDAFYADRYQSLSQELLILKEKFHQDHDHLQVLEETKKSLRLAYHALTNRYTKTIETNFRHYITLLTGKENTPVSDEYDMDSYTLTSDFRIQISRYGKERSQETFSRGGRDLIALCLRFAIADALFNGQNTFLILDDPFINLDDAKTLAAKSFMHTIAKEKQIIYLSCHSSRS